MTYDTLLIFLILTIGACGITLFAGITYAIARASERSRHRLQHPRYSEHWERYRQRQRRRYDD